LLSAAALELFPLSLAFTTLCFSQGKTPFLAVGDKVSFLLDVAQDFVSDHCFSEPLEQSFYRLSGSKYNLGHVYPFTNVFDLRGYMWAVIGSRASWAG
jgi:hypothetical protein